MLSQPYLEMPMTSCTTSCICGQLRPTCEGEPVRISICHSIGGTVIYPHPVRREGEKKGSCVDGPYLARVFFWVIGFSVACSHAEIGVRVS